MSEALPGPQGRDHRRELCQDGKITGCRRSGCFGTAWLSMTAGIGSPRRLRDERGGDRRVRVRHRHRGFNDIHVADGIEAYVKERIERAVVWDHWKSLHALDIFDRASRFCKDGTALCSNSRLCGRSAAGAGCPGTNARFLI